MNDERARGERKPWLVLRAAQWIAFALAVLVLIIALGSLRQLAVPGVSREAAFASIATSVTVALATLPPLFWRLPKGKRWIANVALLPAFFYVMDTVTTADAWYALTPEGAKEASARAKRDAEESRQRAAEDKRRRTEEKLEAAKERLEESIEEAAEQKRKVASCISSWSGQISALSNEVKDSLHNPHAFEHVATEPLDPNPDNNNVTMTFRAENGFGALRSWTVNARVNPDSCDVIHVGEPSQN